MASIGLVITILIVSLWAFSSKGIMERYGFSAYAVNKKGEWDRFISHAFLHADFNHLFINLLVMFFFSPDLELYLSAMFSETFAAMALFLLFLSAAVVSSIPSYFKEKNNPNFISVGASGGVAAIIFSSIVISPLSGICLYGVLCMPGFVWGIAYLVYSYYSDRVGKKDHINHSAHLWGALWGAIFTFIVLSSFGIDLSALYTFV